MAPNFISHLTELRSRIIICFLGLLSGFVLCWNFSDLLLSIVSIPIQPYLSHSDGHLIFTAPMDEFLAHLKIASYGGFIISFPLLCYQVWKFIAPGLYKKEKLMMSLFTLFGSALFILGILFVYYIVYPLSFRILLNFGNATALISIKEYLSFFIQTSLAFGILFEIPLVMIGITWMGLVKVSQLRKTRRYAIVILAVISAAITPPDVISMMFLLGPLYLLYEISILISALLTRSK